MTQEDKDLLLKDLCARLPYEVKLKVTLDLSYDTCFDSITQICDFDATLFALSIDGEPTDLFIHHKDAETESYLNETFRECNEILEDFMSYLRPMSSMTEEERKEYEEWLPDGYCIDTFDWLNKHHFDYRGLIKKGLALEAPEGMYEY